MDDTILECVGLPVTIGIITVFVEKRQHLAPCPLQHLGISLRGLGTCSYPDIVKMDLSPSDISVTPSSQPSHASFNESSLVSFVGVMYL